MDSIALRGRAGAPSPLALLVLHLLACCRARGLLKLIRLCSLSLSVLLLCVRVTCVTTPCVCDGQSECLRPW